MPFNTKPKVEPTAPRPFEVLSHFEDLIKMKSENQKAFSVLSPSLKITLGHYIQQKRAAELSNLCNSDNGQQ